jgi:type IV pilus assembly protein PilB
MNNEQILENNTGAVNSTATQYVDEYGNPIDPSLIDASGNYIGETITQYVDENGNPIDPSLVDASGNYIGNPNAVQSDSINQTQVADGLSIAAGTDLHGTNLDLNNATIHTSEHQMDDKEMFSGMVTFDYNNIPITDIVNSIILDAINKGASDIHFDPFDEGIKIRIRIDGVLNDYSIVPLYVKKNMITRIKIISGMNITESRTPQDGAIRTELANKTIDLRVSCLPTNLGEKIVIRIMDYSMSAAGIEALDFNETNLEKVKKMLDLPNGIILVTGATGTGKSTTVYSMLQRLNVEGTNIITVEDPIEMNIGGINQVQTVSEIGLDFATVLRSILRQDPDVIMIGEIRDEETAKIAVRSAITGHLVLSTIHTNNSLNTIERLTDMDVERYLLGAAISGIISQKLSRRLCEKCKRLRPTNDYEKDMFKKLLNKDVEEIYEPVGCPECSKGYRGRIAIQEVLLVNQAIKDAIIKGVQKSQLRALVYGNNGTETMLQDGLEKVLEGKTSFEEILKLIDLDDDLGTGTELGLEEQIDASTMSMPQYQGAQTLNGPININITPELLAGLNIAKQNITTNTATPQVDKELEVIKDNEPESIEVIDETPTIEETEEIEEPTTEDIEVLEDNEPEDIEVINDEPNEDIEVIEDNEPEENKEDIEVIEDNEPESIEVLDSIEDEDLNKDTTTDNVEVIEDDESEDDESLDLNLDDEFDEIDNLLDSFSNNDELPTVPPKQAEFNNLSDEDVEDALNSLDDFDSISDEKIDSVINNIQDEDEIK